MQKIFSKHLLNVNGICQVLTVAGFGIKDSLT